MSGTVKPAPEFVTHKFDGNRLGAYHAAMTLEEAIRALGGVKATAAVSGINRTTINYWLKEQKWPSWREHDVKRIVALARKTKGVRK